MSEPWEDFAETETAAPWEEYAPSKPAAPPRRSDRVERRRNDKGALRRIDAGMRAAADNLTFGFADELAAAGNSLPALMPGGETYDQAYSRNIADERGIDQADREQTPVSRGIGQVGGFAGSVGLGLLAAPAAPAALPNALANFGRQVGLGSVAGAVTGGLSAAGNATGNALERGQAAIPGAALGAGLGAIAAPVASLVGGGIRAVQNRALPPIDRAANALRSRVDVPAAQAQGNALRAAGANPAAISAFDERGRAFVRAAASRQTPAREVVQRRAEAASENLPGRLRDLSRREISATPRYADDVVEALDEARGVQARVDYGQAYAQPVQISPQMADALSGAEGRRAINSALQTAEARRDMDVVADLQRLRDGQAGEVSAAALDRVQIELGRRGRNVTRSVENQNRGLAAGVYGRQADVNAELDAVPGLTDARGAFAGATRNMQAAEMGRDFLRADPTDFGRTIGAAGDLGGARDAAGYALERELGKGPSRAPAVARSLYSADDQAARSAALLGDDAAGRLAAGARAEAQVVRDHQFVAPNTGSQTALRTQDQETAGELVGTVATIAGGPRAWGAALINRLRTAGISERDAEAVADLATDPRQLDDLLARMEARQPGSGERLRGLITQATARPGGEATQPRAVTVESVVDPVTGQLRYYDPSAVN